MAFEDIEANMPTRKGESGPLSDGGVAFIGQKTLSFSDFVGNDDQVATVALVNSLTTDQVNVSPVAALGANVGIASARISADGTLEVRLHKSAAGASTPGDLVFNVSTFRSTS